MLERLEGRLKWERTAYGIRVLIPARRGSMAGLIGSLAGICLAGAWIEFWGMMVDAESGFTETIVRSMGYGALAGSVCALASWLLVTLTAETVLTVDQTETRIQRQIAGVCWSTRIFATCAMSDLKFVPGASGWVSPEDGPVKSQIRFQADGKMYSFAMGITDNEAAALIGRMRELYAFPNEPEQVTK